MDIQFDVPPTVSRTSSNIIVHNPGPLLFTKMNPGVTEHATRTLSTVVSDSESVATAFEVFVSLNWCSPVLALLDSGAQVNVVSLAYVRAMSNKIKLNVNVAESLTAVDGRPLSVEGIVNIPVRMAGVLLDPPVRFFVLSDLVGSAMSVVLGAEFWLQHLHCVCVQNRTLSLRARPTEYISLRAPSEPPQVTSTMQCRLINLGGRQSSSRQPDPVERAAARVCLIRTVVLHPRSSYFVNGVPSLSTQTWTEAKSSEVESESDVGLLFEPELTGGLGLLESPPALVLPVDGCVPVLLHNPTFKYVRCKAGAVVGHLTTASVQRTSESKLAVHPSRVAQISVSSSLPSDEPAVTDELVLSNGVKIDLSNSIPLDAVQRKKLHDMLQRNIAVFADNPKRTLTTKLTQHRIDTGDSLPISVPPYRVSPSQRAQIDLQAQEMLESGVTRPSSSPYSSPALLVKKSDGKDRFCVDFRRLNQLTKKDVYPLPRIDDMLDALGKADFFSVLDLQSGFWQIPLHPDDMEKTAFSTARGHFEFVVMPFGLCNAPGTFQRSMDQLLRDLHTFCLAYMDDVITFTEGDFDLHITQLERVVERLQSAPMVAKPSKFKVLQRELKFLGHVISRHTIKPDPAKTAAVHSFPTPTCVRDLQSFLGLVNYYRRFVRQMSTIAGPLYALLKKDVTFGWGEVEQTAFDQLKQALTSPPLMLLPNFDRDFVLHTDASATGIGAVLSQLDDDGTEHPVYYASKTLSSSERHYSTTARECLAVKWSCHLFRPYLLGRPFKLYTDHSALRWLFATKHPESIYMRWILQLQEYDMVILSRPGVANANADALSRLPGLLETRDAHVHRMVAVVTRTKTRSLPATHRDGRGLDSSLMLDDKAYDTDEAVRQSLLPSQSTDVELDVDRAVESKSDGADDENSDDDDDDLQSDGVLVHESDAHADVLDTDIPALPEAVPPDSEEKRRELTEAQRADADLSPVIVALEDVESQDPAITDVVRHEAKLYRLYDGVLYHQWDETKVRPRLSTERLRAVIPRSLQLRLLQEYHDGAIGGHLGEAKTYERIADRMFWPTMYADIKEYVRSCTKCAARKSYLHHVQTPLYTIPRPAQPFETLGIDVLGTLPLTKLRNLYIVVITCYHTRWPIAFAMRNQRARTIATLLVEQVFCQHGYPATLLSDRGANFLSQLMASVLKVFHVRKLNTTSYHPQTNGLTERFNHTLCTMLTHFTSKHQDDWDVYLPYVLLAYRTTPHHTLKQTPFYMLYGRNCRFPFDELFPVSALDDTELKVEAADYVDTLITKLKTADDVVRKHLLKADARRLTRNDALTNVVKFNVGDLVWLHSPVVKVGLTRKLTSPWSGPFQVIGKYENLVNYAVQRVDRLGRLVNKAKAQLVHVGRLKPYVNPDMSAIRRARALLPTVTT